MLIAAAIKAAAALGFAGDAVAAARAANGAL
jgi:hypothetical protein